MNQQLTFKTEYECKNCGNEWGECYPPKTKIDDKYRTNSHTAVIDTTCDQIGMVKCDCCRVVACPTCELADRVGVKNREPLRGADD